MIARCNTCPDDADRPNDEQPETDRKDADHDGNYQHDEGARHCRVKHTQGTEEEGEQKCHKDILA